MYQLVRRERLSRAHRGQRRRSNRGGGGGGNGGVRGGGADGRSRDRGTCIRTHVVGARRQPRDKVWPCRACLGPRLGREIGALDVELYFPVRRSLRGLGISPLQKPARAWYMRSVHRDACWHFPVSAGLPATRAAPKDCHPPSSSSQHISNSK